jgi:hypothetical protein
VTTFSITITDAARLAGITAARSAYNTNLSLSPAQGEEGDPGYVPAQAREDHPDYLATDEAYLGYVISSAAESYARAYGTGVPASGFTNPGTPLVPARVSRSQAKAALHLAGLLTQVEALMAAPETDPIAAIFWREEPHFDRNSALIASMGAQLGLSETQIDELFITAASINP